MENAWVVTEIYAEISVAVIDHFFEGLSSFRSDLRLRYATARRLFQVNKSVNAQLMSMSCHAKLFNAFLSARVHLAYLVASSARTLHATRYVPTTVLGHPCAKALNERDFLHALGCPTRAAVMTGRIVVKFDGAFSDERNREFVAETWQQVQADLLFSLLRGGTGLRAECVKWITALPKESFFRETKKFRESVGCGAMALTHMVSFEEELSIHFHRHRNLLCLFYLPLRPWQCYWNVDTYNHEKSTETERGVTKALQTATDYANLLFICFAYEK